MPQDTKSLAFNNEIILRNVNVPPAIISLPFPDVEQSLVMFPRYSY